jgi:hypothetical protein
MFLSCSPGLEVALRALARVAHLVGFIQLVQQSKELSPGLRRSGAARL